MQLFVCLRIEIGIRQPPLPTAIDPDTLGPAEGSCEVVGVGDLHVACVDDCNVLDSRPREKRAGHVFRSPVFALECRRQDHKGSIDSPGARDEFVDDVGAHPSSPDDDQNPLLGPTGLGHSGIRSAEYEAQQ